MEIFLGVTRDVGMSLVTDATLRGMPANQLDYDFIVCPSS